MRVALLFAVITVASCYESIIESFDYGVYRKDMKILLEHANCYLDEGPCDSVPGSVKPHLTEIVSDACRECSDVQKSQGRQFIGAMKEFLPKKYQAFRNKYDLDGKHFDAFEEEIAKFQ